MTRAEKADQLREIAQERILVKDGPYGTAIQSYRLDEAGYRAGGDVHARPEGQQRPLEPDAARRSSSEICNAYSTPAPTCWRPTPSTPTPSARPTTASQDTAREINIAAAKITRACADAATARDPAKPRFVAGALGPTNKTLSVSPNVNDPGYPRRHLRRGEGHLSRADRRPARRRRRLHPDRDGVRHAERQGRHRRRRRGGRGARRGICR